jgi:hypothetical protein
MKILTAILSMVLTVTPTNQISTTDRATPRVVEKVEQKAQHYRARITYYNPDPKWGSRVSCQKTKKAVKGVTIAAHPDFKYGTKVSIPGLAGVVGNGTFIVQDRGPAVTTKKASDGQGYVFDVYVDTMKISTITKRVPMWMDVYVLTN